jgi:hypothetical protein
MKKSTLTLIACLLFIKLSFAHNGDPKPHATTLSSGMEDTDVSLKDIFLSDFEGHVLFIDFQALKGDVIQLNLLQGNTIIMNEDVHELPGDTIYELDLEMLSAGNYRVELRTSQGIYIQKEIVVD